MLVIGCDAPRLDPAPAHVVAQRSGHLAQRRPLSQLGQLVVLAHGPTLDGVLKSLQGGFDSREPASPGLRYAVCSRRHRPTGGAIGATRSIRPRAFLSCPRHSGAATTRSLLNLFRATDTTGSGSRPEVRSGPGTPRTPHNPARDSSKPTPQRPRRRGLRWRGCQRADAREHSTPPGPRRSRHESSTGSRRGLGRPGAMLVLRGVNRKGAPCPTFIRPGRPAPPRRVAADHRSSQSARRAAPRFPRRRASSCAARPTARAMGFWPHARSRPARPSWSASWSGR